MNKKIYMVKIFDINHFTALTNEEYNMILERMNGQKVDVEVFEYICGTVCSMHRVEKIVDLENEFDIDTIFTMLNTNEDIDCTVFTRAMLYQIILRRIEKSVNAHQLLEVFENNKNTNYFWLKDDDTVIPINTKSEMLNAVFFNKEPLKTRTLNVSVFCQAYYNSSIKVPIELNEEEALEYAAEHLKEIPLGKLEYISDSDELDYENSSFEE